MQDLESELEGRNPQQNINEFTDEEIVSKIESYEERIETISIRFPEELHSAFMQPHLKRWRSAIQDLKEVQQHRNKSTS